MIRIVQCVHKVFVEWVNVLESWEAIENCLEFLREGLGGEFDLSCVEASDTRNFEASSDLCGQSSLCPTEYNIDKLL